MKKLTKIAAVAMFGFAALASTTANAIQAQGSFNVIINLTASCTVASPISNVTIAYTANQAAAVGPLSTTANVTCTTGVPYNVSLSASTASVNSTTTLDDITGITYTTAFSGATARTGTGSAQPVNFTVDAAGSQVGTCNSPGTFVGSVCANTLSLNRQQTLTITY